MKTDTTLIDEYDKAYLDKITNGKDLKDFRFFAECERVDMAFSFCGTKMYSYSNRNKDVVECKLENPAYGKIDIVPIDYPMHASRRTYICDVEAMFKSYSDRPACFVRKNESSKIVDRSEREWLSPGCYVEHTWKEII